MNSVSEAINTLISAVNIGHSKGAYSLEEAHYIYLAIAYLNSLQQQAPQEPKAPQVPQQPTQEPQDFEGPQDQGY